MFPHATGDEQRQEHDTEHERYGSSDLEYMADPLPSHGSAATAETVKR